jgi:type II secretory pathway component PulC
MAEKGSSTPERELLRLIEEPGSADKIPRAKAKLKFLSLFSPPALKARFSYLKLKFKGGFSLKNLTHLEFRLVNRVLELFIFLLLFYLISSLIISVANLNKKSSLEFKIKKMASATGFSEVSLLKVSSYYLEKARARDIFKMGLGGVAEAKQVTRTPVSKIAEATQNLKLVGISWSEDPDVIIEDTKAGRAYFLKRGQTINDFTVKAVFRDKVILSYQGEEIELR